MPLSFSPCPSPVPAARGACWGILALALALALALPANAATLGEKAKESGCIAKPRLIDGQTLYKCETASGAFSYFNVPADGAGALGTGSVLQDGSRRGSGTASPSRPATSATPGFPRVDAETQRGRDDMRRRVLSDELATEEKLLREARVSYADGAPTPLPEERTDADRYRDRIARLRQAVATHERNVDALKKELGNMR